MSFYTQYFCHVLNYLKSKPEHSLVEKYYRSDDEPKRNDVENLKILSNCFEGASSVVEVR